MRSVLFRFPDLGQFEHLVCDAGEPDFELAVPPGEVVQDGEWVLAVFELGSDRRATSAAAQAAHAPDGTKLVFEPRDWDRLVQFARAEMQRRAAAEATQKEADRKEAAQDARAEGTPMSLAAQVSSRSLGRGRNVGAGSRILIVDDDPDIRNVVSAMLEAVGLVAAPVGSAEEALSRVRAETFDLLVLDWNLPKMTGIDLCRLVRDEPALETIPILFLTANASSQDMVEAFASGADDYVVKPFRAPELGARIFSLLRRAKMAAI